MIDETIVHLYLTVVAATSKCHVNLIMPNVESLCPPLFNPLWDLNQMSVVKASRRLEVIMIMSVWLFVYESSTSILNLH